MENFGKIKSTKVYFSVKLGKFLVFYKLQNGQTLKIAQNAVEINLPGFKILFGQHNGAEIVGEISEVRLILIINNNWYLYYSLGQMGQSSTRCKQKVTTGKKR